MTGPNQRRLLTKHFLDHPHLIPSHRFEPVGAGRIRCVLCHRHGLGVVTPDPNATYPVAERGHRLLLQFIAEELHVVEGPDTAPPAPKPIPLALQFSPWQIVCLQPHDWECTCGRRFYQYAALWRHIGGPRPHGWGRQDGIDHALVEHSPWPPVGAER